MNISDDRNNRDESRTDARIALVEAIKHDSVHRGLSHKQIAEKHQVSESTVRSVVNGNNFTDAEVFKVVVNQLGTDNRTVITVVAPKGTTYKDVVEQFRRS